ncbi:glycoside hydrolase family 2 TIM barrel-domain containing protein [Spirosoma utsteinense]|uniref:glycoside hydrolase family 2 TIM barrel-domain containing protein n=1 Tax=Spirosoma utsteinense TaxID=2585773 RepID=UPI001EC2BB2C|nr:glycoside hydrolase family 2 TIM barrel-domain containing protein [Spirosoma utsteinense]MBC3788890.1 hypothetical protein [Spirosoma utsteinense]
MLIALSYGCQPRSKRPPNTNPDPAVPTAIRWTGHTYALMRYGEPYFIKGAGGISHFEQLKEAGGNSIRVWDDADAGQILDEAQRMGLTVMLGLWVEREMESFDYEDQAAVERQYQRIKKTILKYRNHPALLLWCVGNEWAQEADNVKVYDEVNRLSKLVHQLDPNHPVSTAISPDSKRAVWLVSQRCPDLDILAVNSYALTEQLADFFKQGGWTKPYLISEYGAPAYWETPVSPWGAPDEPNSQQKRTSVRNFYQRHIGSTPPNCLGAYLFYWGAKQEETHTWFSVFDEAGHASSLVDLMQELWSGNKPANLAPVVQTLLIDGKPQLHRSYPSSPEEHEARFVVQDPEHDSLTYEWEVKPRAQPGTDYIGVPRPPLTGLITSASAATIRFRLPDEPGAYRLFANVYDSHGHVSTANFSFAVKPKRP